ncbi:hypothetical protein LWI28_018319 [Acer negundo]|uniref:Uncharacterized protein n=1 Tax=Acer negundo TaxID=4023 RepID=A0AAD5NNS8_ACENE|nr:hypothetical protein LWI28_018319 [Acer negundo]
MTDVVKPVVSWESGNSAGINAINAEAINTINVIKSLEEKVETAIKGVLLANQQEGDDYLADEEECKVIVESVWKPKHGNGRIPSVLNNIRACGSLLEACNAKKRKEMRKYFLTKRNALKEACKVDKPASWRFINKLEHQLDEVLSTQERYWKQRARIE